MTYTSMVDAMKQMDSWYGGLAKFGDFAERPLSSVSLIDDGAKVQFQFQDGGALTYGVEGDCCSSSWIEHLTVPPDIDGAVVDGFWESAPVDDEKILDDGDVVTVYQFAFRTDKGEIIVEYRNASNGYYGGYLVGPIQAS